MTDEQRPAEWKVISAGAMLTLSGSAIYFLMPIYLGSMMESLSLSSTWAGVLSGGEYYAIALTSLTGPFWVNRFNWRKLVMAAIVISIIGHTVTMLLDNYAYILTARILTGLLGEGILYSISFAVLADTRNPDRNFGIAMIVTVVVTAVAIFYSSTLNDIFGRNAMVLVLLGSALMTVFILSWLPVQSEKAQKISRTDTTLVHAQLKWLPALGLLALAIWFIGPGGFWAFAERMAVAQDVTRSQISLGFALATGIGVIGPLVPICIGTRFGRIWPVVLPTAIMTVLVILYSGNFTASEFTLYVIFFSIFWGVGSVYLFGLIAEIDWNGRCSVLTPAFQSMGLGAGPVIIGLLVDIYGYGSVGWAYAVLTSISILLFLYVVLYSGASKSILREADVTV